MARNSDTVRRSTQVQESDEAQTPSLMRKCIAEFLGTTFLVYAGCGALTVSGYLTHNKATFTMADLLAVSLAFGLAISIMVYAIGHISGCHINPAVSLALACTRRISWSQAGAYIVAQFLGGIFGALLIAITFGAHSAAAFGYGATNYNVSFVNYFGAIIVEAIGTFFLVFVIMAMVMDRRAPMGWAGFSIGLTVTAAMLVTGGVTGGNFNPARAFGPTIIEMMFGSAYPFGHMFIYFIGPIIGGIAGAFTYEYLALRRPSANTAYHGFEAGD